jgi:CTP synthase (UTP-ammonia lyase)
VSPRVKIGIIGDFDSNKSSHIATNDALHHTADRLSVEVDITWIATLSLLNENGLYKLRHFDGIWASPGDYQSMEGVLKGVKLAREKDRPFVGT